MQVTNKERDYARAAVIFFGFGFVCLLTAFILSFDVQEKVLSVSGKGREYALTVPSDNSVYEVEVKQNARSNSWVFITGQVLDANKRYLFSFGDELWHASGYDSDGRWSERKAEYEMDFTIREAGRYYVVFKREYPGNQPEPPSATVTIERNLGSSLPFIILGILGLIIGALLGRRTAANMWEAFSGGSYA